jgi:hypothetical protein
MNNPAPGSRIRSIRAFDRGVGRCRTLAVGFWLAAGRSRLWTGTAISGLTGERWVRRPLFQRT